MEERIARLESDVAHMRADISDIKGDIRQLNGKVDGVKTLLDARTEAITAAAAAQALATEKSFARVEKSIAAQALATEKSFARVEKSIADLALSTEKAFGNLRTSMEKSFGQDIARIRTDMAGMKGDINRLDSKIAALRPADVWDERAWNLVRAGMVLAMIAMMFKT